MNVAKIESRLDYKLLGVFIDNQLTFKSHMCRMLKKASQMLSALT